MQSVIKVASDQTRWITAEDLHYVAEQLQASPGPLSCSDREDLRRSIDRLKSINVKLAGRQTDLQLVKVSWMISVSIGWVSTEESVAKLFTNPFHLKKPKHDGDHHDCKKRRLLTLKSFLHPHIKLTHKQAFLQSRSPFWWVALEHTGTGHAAGTVSCVVLSITIFVNWRLSLVSN